MTQEKSPKILKRHLSPDEINEGTYTDFMRKLEDARKREEGEGVIPKQGNETAIPAIVKNDPKV